MSTDILEIFLDIFGLGTPTEMKTPRNQVRSVELRT